MTVFIYKKDKKPDEEAEYQNKQMLISTNQLH